MISERLTAGGGSVHVWGAIWHCGQSPIRILRVTVNGLRYCETLQTLLAIPKLPINWVLQDDNARPHRCMRLAILKKLMKLEVKFLTSKFVRPKFN